MRRIFHFALLLACCACNDLGDDAVRHDIGSGADSREDMRPEQFTLSKLEQRPDVAGLELRSHMFDTDEDAQPATLPPMPPMMTPEMIAAGDALFHGKGGCVHCHGSEAQGLPARGKTLTAGLGFVPKGAWSAIDSVIAVGMPDMETRSTIAMPARGRNSNLDAAEMHRIGAYVWAISQVRGEPWPGGHAVHFAHDWRASSRTDIP